VSPDLLVIYLYHEIKFQVKKLVLKCISRDSMHYRKITDKPLPGQGGEKEEN
jgi:hypothetical protein